MQGSHTYVLEKLEWMRDRQIWPNGSRYLWTDAFGVVLLVSLYRTLGDDAYLEQAEWVVAEVDRVLGRERGIRIGEAPDRDGQYFHYLAMWIYALGQLGTERPAYRERALELVREIHEPFVQPGVGVYWKMTENLERRYPGFGLGALDAFHGYVVYRQLAPQALAGEIEEMKTLVELSYPTLNVDQDLGLGMMLWMTHFYPKEQWATIQRERCLDTLDRMWIVQPGYFCRRPDRTDIKFAFTNYGVSLGLQAVDVWPGRVGQLNAFFEEYRSGDEYDTAAITHVMACTSRLPGLFLKRGAQPETQSEEGS
ncbi:MAG: hypothetical protein R3248_11020 [Candidatus Promineifilaceae bacterium]|nr:hypothetical protein [Candidatus Promineifilaceae bacterium]